ncbi:hypothetical protein F2Q68_00016388 [Brassica cretica]|uniref:Uncharacterized protein n=1 Tax=Brassica cretica TaxID=69181 RepID=A0A8S9HS36_BRACR|nr:hypothetical protein F2Q68_00016388 [Brassica cretica]
MQKPNACSARSLHSNRAEAEARLLRSDRASFLLGRYVATELEPKLGLYVATEPLARNVELDPKLGRYVATECSLGRYIATELFRNVDTTLVHALLVYPSMLSPEDRSEPISRSPPF